MLVNITSMKAMSGLAARKASASLRWAMGISMGA
jgi:hypothetical protein